MLEEEGVVLSVSGSVAEVVAETKSSCGSCSAKSGCGTSLLASLFPQRKRSFRANNTVSAKTGDRVIIGLDESALQIASLLVYLVPLLGLIGGAIIGAWLAPQLAPDAAEPFSIIAGIAGFSLVLLVVRRISPWLSGRGRYQASILRVLKPESVSEYSIRTIGNTKG
ncbi:SoxR reducing system RseC family protein [Thiolapillus sp.]